MLGPLTSYRDSFYIGETFPVFPTEKQYVHFSYDEDLLDAVDHSHGGRGHQQNYCHYAKFFKGKKAGIAEVQMDDGRKAKIRIKEKPIRRHINNVATLTNLRRACNVPNAFVTTSRNSFYLDEPLRLARGVILAGPLTLYTNDDFSHRGLPRPGMIVPADDAIVKNITFESSNKDIPAFFSVSSVVDFSIIGCKFQSTWSGEWGGKGDLITNCVFDDCNLTLFRPHTWIDRILLTGGSNVTSWHAKNCILTHLDSQSGDGIHMSPYRGDIENCVFWDLNFNGVAGFNNGAESFLVEIGDTRYSFKNNTVGRVRLNSGEGSIIQFWNTRASGNRFQDIRARGGGGIAIAMDKNSWFRENQFKFVELRNCNMNLYYGNPNDARRFASNEFIDFGIIDPEYIVGNSWRMQVNKNPVIPFSNIPMHLQHTTNVFMRTGNVLVEY